MTSLAPMQTMPRTLDDLIQAAETAGLTTGDVVTWMRTRDGIAVNAARRDRLRSTEEWKAAVARTVVATGMLEPEILSRCRQHEYVRARDMLVDILASAGWSTGAIASAMDQSWMTVKTAVERIRRKKRLQRKLEVVK
jgi:DNA-binding NarL/FixJ family response regulator